MRSATILSSLILTSALGCGSRGAVPSETRAANSRVDRLFEKLHRGEWGRIEYPELSWEDIDALLERADDPQLLTRFPIAPFSSQSQATCSVGVLALWFIEGVRIQQRGGHPSLNPLLLGPRANERDWLEDSESNRELAADAYRRWWSRVQSASNDVRSNSDPLEGTGLGWH